jgi:hypothetical protein
MNSTRPNITVTPANAGVQGNCQIAESLDSRFRGNDGTGV